MANLPRSDGWWYIPKISKLLYIDSNHIMVLYNNYKDFGITEEELDNWHKKWNIKSLYDCKEIGNYEQGPRDKAENYAQPDAGFLQICTAYGNAA